MEQLQKIIESLNPHERVILPHLHEGEVDAIQKKVGLDSAAIVRALEYLSNKGVVKTTHHTEKHIVVALNGLLYLKQGLPERTLGAVVAEHKSIPLADALKKSKLNANEFKAAIGVLKKKKLISLVNGTLLLVGSKENIIKTSSEEKFLESLPRFFNTLNEEEKKMLLELKKRKNIVAIEQIHTILVSLTDVGTRLVALNLAPSKDLIEVLTPSILRSHSWKGKKFRRYDIESPVPLISGGKRHFVAQATEYAQRIWLDMGFKEMRGPMTTSGFYNFDALFTAQDHPVRDMQDTFFIKEKKATLSDPAYISAVKKAHEGDILGSRGWQYDWKKEDAEKVLLRTHTTCLSPQTMQRIAKEKEFPAKYFALGKCFRNETVDWSHGFEFNQTEGIVIDEHANFRQLLGYLKEFFKKMGYEHIRIRPGYFPYTEPSLEIDIFHPQKKKWLEFGGAGMFRPEVTIPLFGRHIPVLAWGPGFDRIIMEFFAIHDLREMYKNTLTDLRERRMWYR